VGSLRFDISHGEGRGRFHRHHELPWGNHEGCSVTVSRGQSTLPKTTASSPPLPGTASGQGDGRRGSLSAVWKGVAKLLQEQSKKTAKVAFNHINLPAM